MTNQLRSGLVLLKIHRNLKTAHDSWQENYTLRLHCLIFPEIHYEERNVIQRYLRINIFKGEILSKTRPMGIY